TLGRRKSCRWGRLCRQSLVRSGVGEFGDDFCFSGFADRAITVPDARLSERELLAAGTSLRIKPRKNRAFVLGRRVGEVDGGKLAGAIGVGQKNLTGILEGFDTSVDGHAKERRNFVFVEQWIAKSFVLLHDAPLGIEHERGGQRRDSAILQANVGGG